jgi:hypothetical protein
MKYQYITASERELKNLTFRGLQKECILRCIDFDLVSKLDFYGLSSWFDKNFNNPCNPENLLLFDEWFEKQLKPRITEKDSALLSKHLRFSVSVEEKAELEKELEKAKPKEDKPKKSKEKDESGIIKGTKKSLTFQLAKEGKSIKMIIKKVLKTFPDASETSIRIWYKKALIQ